MTRRKRPTSGDDIAHVSIHDRDVVCFIVVCIVAVAVVVGLVRFQVLNAGYYRESARNQQFQSTALIAKRGTIYDRNGEVLASSVTSYTVNINPSAIAYAQSVGEDEVKTLPDAREAVAQLLYEYLGEASGKTLDELRTLTTTAKAGDGTDIGYAVIARKAAEDDVERLQEALAAQSLEGVFYEEDSTRVYPNGTVASQLIGTVGLKVLNEDGVIVEDDDIANYDYEQLTEAYRGTTGLELQYDGLLAGTNGKVRQDRGRDGILIAGGQVEAEPAENGADIVTSIDLKLQQRAEKSLKKACKKYKAQGGSVTVMDAATGEIYAACSYERGDDGTYDFDAGKLWSVADSYEPGSTLKALTAASLLENNAVTANTTFTVPNRLKVYDSTVADSHDHDTEVMTFRQIIAESSNIGTVLASRTVDLDDLYQTYHSFGFGQNPGVDFPGAAAGLLEETADWDGVQAANITFGQGVAVTGMQLIRAYGALEQGGTLRVPHFYVSSTGNEGVFEGQHYRERVEALTATQKASKKKVCAKVTSMLESVVTEGTGTAGAVEGFTVAAKTGTAEIPNSTGGYKAGAYIVSYCGWLEGSDSDLVCLVTVEEPETEEGGGPVCGPVFADIMSFAADRYQISANTR